MKIKIIGCEVMKEELLSIPPAHQTHYTFIPTGLHQYPDKLNVELQEQLDQSKGFSHIVLAFGLCGGAARTLKSLDSVIIIPKVHDCIPLLLGSREVYESLKNEELGTFYYSCGWFKGERSFLSEYEVLCGKYGKGEALEMIKLVYEAYKKFIFIHTGHPQEKTCLEKSKMISRLLDLQFVSVKGQKEYLYKLVRGPWNEDEFITLNPGTELVDSMFHT